LKNGLRRRGLPGVEAKDVDPGVVVIKLPLLTAVQHHVVTLRDGVARQDRGRTGFPSLVVGHSPMNEAAFLGLTRRLVQPWERENKRRKIGADLLRDVLGPAADPRRTRRSEAALTERGRP
jgi:hypothetical protein